MEKRSISAEEAARLGITTNHEQMENGEFRLRLGPRYILTRAGATGAWQKSHSHRRLQEVYVVVGGWIAFAEMRDDGACQIRILREGDIVITEPGVEHNVYLPAGAEFDVLKVNVPQEVGDWYACPTLDVLTRDARLNMEQILSMDEFRLSQQMEDGFMRYICVSAGGDRVEIKKK